MRRYFDFCVKPLDKIDNLKIFERDIQKEKYLDTQSISRNSISFFSLHFFCEKLVHLVGEFNTFHSRRVDLVRFLSDSYYQSLHSIESIEKRIPNDGYISALLDYVDYLYEKLELLPYYLPTLSLDEKIKEITDRIVKNNSNINQAFPAEEYWDVRKVSFGFAMLDRRVNFYICDSWTKMSNYLNEENINLRMTVIIFLQETSDELFSKIFLQYIPLRLVLLDNGKVKNYLDMRTGFTSSVLQLKKKCKNLQSKGYLHDHLRSNLIKIDEYLDFISFRIESFFNDIWRTELKERDFLLVTAKLKFFSYELQTYTMDDHIRKIASDLMLLSDSFHCIFEQRNTVHSVPNIIYAGLSNITRNADLYRLSGNASKNDNVLFFGENNLSAVLAMWLDAKFHGKKLSTHREEMIGNGRTDISIFYDKAHVAIIECKLFQSHSPESVVKNAIKKGIYQVFEKYSFALVYNILFPPRMYLVLFSFDPDYKRSRDHLYDVLKDINIEKAIVIKESEHVNNQWLRFCILQNHDKYPAKEIYLDIMLVSLRTRDDKNKTHGKYK